MCTSHDGAYVFSIPGKQKHSKDSPEAGLLASLARAVAAWSATQSTLAAPNGSDAASSSTSNGCQTCEGSGEVAVPVSQDMFGNWDVDYYPCPDCDPSSEKQAPS